jgi:hypothetical protein
VPGIIGTSDHVLLCDFNDEKEGNDLLDNQNGENSNLKMISGTNKTSKICISVKISHHDPCMS